MASPKRGMRKGLTAYGDEDFSLFLRKAFVKGMGYTDDALDRPIIGITNTFSGFNACHRNVPELIEAVKRGVMLAGGLPVEFPTITLHESFAHPTSMYLRNLMSIDTEEMIRGQPVDAVVLIGGCDKTVPAQLMGALSADIPAVLGWTGACTYPNWDLAGLCSVLRSWEDRFGAVLVGLGPDRLRLSVERPPRYPEQARQLAGEHYGLAPDVIDQDPEAYAELLFSRREWDFWWN